MRERIERLNALVSYLQTQRHFDVRFMGHLDIKELRQIFGKNGYHYIKEEDIDVSTMNGVIDALKYCVYEQNKKILI